MKATKIFALSAFITLGLFVSTKARAIEPDAAQTKFAKSTEFSGDDKNYEGFALPEVTCDTGIALNKLKTYVRQNPLPTHDGVSPWPGLWGFWVHQRAGVYSLITGYKTEDKRNSGVRVRLINLCTNEVLAEGKTEIPALELPMSSFSVSLDNKKLNKVKDPHIVISRVAEPQNPEKQSDVERPAQNLVGLTLKYKVKDSDGDSELEEAILLKNLLNR